jgi:hypothetical protein
LGKEARSAECIVRIHPVARAASRRTIANLNFILANVKLT